jgi:hypothetical protein
MTPEKQLHQLMLQMESSTRTLHHIGIGLILFYIFIFLLSLAGITFWIWMLIDCIKRKKGNTLIGWVLVMGFLSVFGAIVYFFAGRDANSQNSSASDDSTLPTVKVVLNSNNSVRSETITKVEPSPGGLTVYFANGQTKVFHWVDFPKLLNSHQDERAKWRLSTDGMAIVWPELEQRIDYAALFLR